MLPTDRLRRAGATDDEIAKLERIHAGLSEASQTAVEEEYASQDEATIAQELQEWRDRYEFAPDAGVLVGAFPAEQADTTSESPAGEDGHDGVGAVDKPAAPAGSAPA